MDNRPVDVPVTLLLTGEVELSTSESEGQKVAQSAAGLFDPYPILHRYPGPGFGQPVAEQRGDDEAVGGVEAGEGLVGDPLAFDVVAIGGVGAIRGRGVVVLEKRGRVSEMDGESGGRKDLTKKGQGDMMEMHCR